MPNGENAPLTELMSTGIIARRIADGLTWLFRQTTAETAKGRRQKMKEKIEKLLSEILSDKYDCVVRIRFEKKVNT
jgi:hypothetical protein